MADTTTSTETFDWDSFIELSSPFRYPSWKNQIRRALGDVGARDFLDTEAKPEPSPAELAEYQRKKSRACSLIILTLDEDYLDLIVDQADDARAMWKRLEEHFELQRRYGKRLALLRLYSLRYTGQSIDDIDAYLREYRGAVDECRSFGAQLDDLNVSAHLLASLPPSFATLETVAMNLGGDDLPKPEKLYSMIRDSVVFAARRQPNASSTTTAHRARGRRQTRAPRRGG